MRRQLADAQAYLDRVMPDNGQDEQEPVVLGNANPVPEPETELPNETSMVIYDSRGWRIDARPGEVKLRSEYERSMTPADISDLMQALNFARGRARGQGEDSMHAW